VKLPRIALILCLAAALAPAASGADFEGVLELKGTQSVSKGQTTPSVWRIYVSPKASRFEMEMATSAAQKQKGAADDFKMVMLTKVAEPHMAYMINDKTKSYSVTDTRNNVPDAGAKQKTWVVRNMGTDKVAGFACTKFLATQTAGDSEIEGCMSDEFFSSPGWAAALRGNTDRSDWVKAVWDEGLKGFPIRMVTRTKGKPEALASYELVKAERKKLPASTFEIPAGYKKAGSMMETMMTPEQMKTLQDAQREAMKDMTPEQRKQYEEMMKNLGAPTPAPQR
jgi:hypothetical protein